MALYPQLGSPYFDEQHKGILSRMETFYAEAITINLVFWGEANTDTRFEIGDQTLWAELYAGIPTARRHNFNFNIIKPIINMVSGHQRKVRKSTIVTAVENGDAETSDQFTKILMWVNNQENVLETISEAFQGALVTGMNLLQVWVDYRSDPVSGNIKVDNCSYNSFLIDPYFRKADLSDCNGLWKRSFLTKRDCLSLFPDKEEEILELNSNISGTGRDGKFQFMPESYNYGYKNLLTYDEFYYKDYRTQKMLVDMETGETLEWKSEDKEALEAFLAQEPSLTVVESEIPTVRLAVVIQGKVMYDGPNPLGIDQYPFVAVFAYYNPQVPDFPYRVCGMVRGLRDPQYLFNRRLIIGLDMAESMPTSGYIFKEDSLVNPKDVYLTGQGRGIALKTDAQMTDVQQIQPTQIPNSYFQLTEMLDGLVSKISGVNEELMGSADDEKAGILSMLRQGAGLTTLQGLFDQLDRAQKQLGDIMIDVIQANFTPGKVKKILEGEEPTAQFYNKAFGKYNAVVEEGLNTSTQKQMQFAQMLQLHEAGVPITTEDLLEASTLQGKKKIIENATKQKEQAMEMQQMQMQVEMQFKQAQIEDMQGRKLANQGLYEERSSRVAENRSMSIERLHQSNREDNAAFLDKVKALKELEDMDIGHIERLVSIANSLKAAETAESEAGVAKVAAQPA